MEHKTSLFHHEIRQTPVGLRAGSGDGQLTLWFYRDGRQVPSIEEPTGEKAHSNDEYLLTSHGTSLRGAFKALLKAMPLPRLK